MWWLRLLWVYKIQVFAFTSLIRWEVSKKKFDLWEKTREVIQTEKKNSKQGPLERIALA